MITPVIQPLANPYDNSFYYGNYKIISIFNASKLHNCYNSKKYFALGNREHYINASQKNGDAQVKTIMTNTENATGMYVII